MKRKVFYSVLTVIIASFFLNNWYANNKKMGLPIVIPSYISTLADDSMEITLYYVKDRHDKRTLQKITFGDTDTAVEGDTSHFFEENTSKLHTIDTFNYQTLNRASFHISAGEIADIYKKDILAKDIQVILSDGTGYTKFKAKQNMNLTLINMPKELKKYYDVQVMKSNQRVDLPIKLNKGETLSINTKIKGNIPFSYDAIIPLLSDKDRVGFISLLNNSTISEKDIENLVKEYGR